MYGKTCKPALGPKNVCRCLQVVVVRRSLFLYKFQISPRNQDFVDRLKNFSGKESIHSQRRLMKSLFQC